MNGLKKLAKGFKGKNKTKNLIISIVILIEVISLLTVATFAWVETVSSIKITNEANTHGDVDTYVYTEAEITSQTAQWTHTDGFIDLAKYFKKSGNMHLAPASSADGRNFFFPQVASTGYRQGNVSDKNTTYMSITFKLRVEDNVDFFFYKPVSGSGPAFTGSGESFDDEDIRVSVTAYSEGNSPTAADTKVYAKTADDDATVVNGRSSSDTTEIDVKSFASAVKGSGSANKLFSVGAEETKIVTINLWLQSNSANMNGSSKLSENITIQDLGIISSMTPRHVTLVPGSEWRGNNPTFYAWCFSANNGSPNKLYRLKPNNFDGTFSFDYPGNYQNMVFVRAKPEAANRFDTDPDNPGTTLASDTDFWSDYAWNQTEDAPVPESPVDPTYFIYDIDGSSEKWGPNNDRTKSTGAYEKPALIRLKYIDGQDESWGTISGVYDSYTSTYDVSSDMKQVRMITRGSVTGSTHSFQAKATVTNVTGKSYSDYAFVGWYTDPSGTTPATGFTSSTVGNTTTSTRNTPAADTETVYYARFKKVRRLTIEKYIDGAVATASSGAVGTITINNQTSAADVISKYVTVDMGDPVAFSAAASYGYTLEGIYTSATGGTKVYTAGDSATTINLNTDTTYYARFTTNTHTVQLNRIGTTGSSTVQYGNETASTSVTRTGVKYNSLVTIKANPAAGYEFVGWYTNSSGTGTAESTDASYTFTLGDADVTYYAKFKAVNIYLTGWINGAAVTTGETALKFSSSGNANEYTLNYTFTGNQDGYQYVTIYDGANVYHPATHESGSGVAADLTQTDTGPNNDPKWKVNATSHDVVTFTWNNSTKTLSWSITKYYYFDCSSCSWFKNNDCVPAVSYNNGAYQPATLVSGNLYRVAIPESVTTFSLARHNNFGNYNAFNVSKSGTNNRYNINSNCNGGSWTTY